ncbi:VOC family protein [Agromyces protaetiae]|uniref:VOC family protein n=1 Tax=Agromyces protaetiae TaxID=2509455 RepID=A0A4P6FCH3_9MICO|nr:VOC family protein [Agromyces protaetiae]QAY73752.1 VOC family protein [Agromyces protaetiae]
MLTALTIRYVADVEASRRFYEGLGLDYLPEASVPVWAQLDAAAGAVGLHDAAASKGRAPGAVELAFATDEKLEEVAARLAAGGYAYELAGEDFGRSLRVTDPDGVVVQIQEIDPATMRESQAAL